MAKNKNKLLPILFPILIFLLGILLCIPAVLPILKNGLFPIHDDTQLVRVFEMANSLGSGIFPARWVEDLGYGYGYPIFNFYAPFAYYVGGITTLLFHNVVLATEWMYIIGALLAFVTMFLFIRSFLGVWAALTAGILYMYFPYHAVNIYIRGAVGEYYAYAFLPLVSWGFFKLYEIYQEKTSLKNSYKWILLSAIGIALVAISHNLTLFMLGLVSVVFFVYAIFTLKEKRIFTIAFFSACFLGFLLSSFYVVPAVLEAKYTNVESQIGGGADYPDHFVCIKQLYESPWGFGGSVPGCTDGVSFKIGKINSLFLLLSVGLFIFSKIKKFKNNHDKTEIASYILFAVSIFMMLPVSQFLWDGIPKLEFVQYPWRFLNFVGLFFSIIIAFFVYRLKLWFVYAPIVAAIAIIGLTLFFNLKLFTPQSFKHIDFSEILYQPNIRWDTSKISDEYMPKGFLKPTNKDEIAQKSFEIIGEGSFSDFEKNPKLISSKISLKKDSQVKFFLAYFPTWNFYVNDKKIEPLIRNNGVIISLPPGDYHIAAEYHQTVVEKIGNALSLIGILIVFAVIIRYTILKNHGKKAS